MRTSRLLTAVVLAALARPSLVHAQQGHDDALRIVVTFDHRYRREPVTGSVYLLLTSELTGEPREHLGDWPMRGYVFRLDVSDWEADTPLEFGPETPGYPASLGEIAPHKYNVQAIIDVSPTDYEFTRAHGNGRSRALRLFLDPAASGAISVTVDTEITRNPLVDIPRVRYRRIESRSVGRTLGTRFFVTVAVVLPVGYWGHPDRRYPVQYWIPGLGERARGAVGFFQRRGIFNPHHEDITKIDDFIRVILDPHARRGHHGWVDSDVNGPFMTSFFTEILPAIEEEFRIVGDSSARFLVGRGTGGLAALRLLVARPDFFAGAWALAPDPVDFHDFYGLDLYAEPPENAYVDARGIPRPLVRKDGRDVITIREQAAFEEIVGTGNLFQSSEATCSPRDGRGRPRPIFDRSSGIVNRDVASHWARHDLTRTLLERWHEIGRHLDGKIRILVGDQDNYRLANGVTRLRAVLDDVKANAHIDVLPGVDHPGIDAPEIHRRVQREITSIWRSR